MEYPRKIVHVRPVRNVTTPNEDRKLKPAESAHPSYRIPKSARPRVRKVGAYR